MQEEEKIRYLFYGCTVILAVIIILLVYSLVSERNPQSFSEFWLAEPIPSQAAPDEPINFSFFIHNSEGFDLSYEYYVLSGTLIEDVNLFKELPLADSRMHLHETVLVKNKEKKKIDIAITLPFNERKQKVLIALKHPGLQRFKTLHFWLQVSQAD